MVSLPNIMQLCARFTGCPKRSCRNPRSWRFKWSAHSPILKPVHRNGCARLHYLCVRRMCSKECRAGAFLRYRGLLLVRAGSSGHSIASFTAILVVLYGYGPGTGKPRQHHRTKVACRGIFALMGCQSLVNGFEPVEECLGRCWRTLRGPRQMCGHTRLLVAPHSRRHRPV